MKLEHDTEHLVFKYFVGITGASMWKFVVRRGPKRHQIVVAIILGVVSGCYIWKPSLEEKYGEQRRLEAEAEKNETQTLPTADTNKS